MSIPNIESWNTGTLFAAYRNSWSGALRTGTVTISHTLRLTNATDDVIIPPGIFVEQPLNAEGSYSFNVTLPATDDSDIDQSGWGWRVEVNLSASGPDPEYTEVFYNVAVAAGGSTNLRTLQPSNHGGTPGPAAPDLRNYVTRAALLEEDFATFDGLSSLLDWESAITILEGS